jgi:hypothetical protein
MVGIYVVGTHNSDLYHNNLRGLIVLAMMAARKMRKKDATK